MGKFASLSAALALNLGGIFVFRGPHVTGIGPFVSCLLFQVAMFVLLLHTGVYPKPLKTMPGCAQDFFEFWPGILILEMAVCDFWIPIEAAAILSLTTVANFENELLEKVGFSRGYGLLQFLRWRGSGIVASYVLSVYFLLAVLHATKIIDMKMLGLLGFWGFLGYVAQRLRKIPIRAVYSLGLARKKVRFSKKNKYREIRDESPSKPRRRCRQQHLPRRQQKTRCYDFKEDLGDGGAFDVSDN